MAGRPHPDDVIEDRYGSSTRRDGYGVNDYDSSSYNRGRRPPVGGYGGYGDRSHYYDRSPYAHGRGRGGRGARDVVTAGHQRRESGPSSTALPAVAGTTSLASPSWPSSSRRSKSPPARRMSVEAAASAVSKRFDGDTRKWREAERQRGREPQDAAADRRLPREEDTRDVRDPRDPRRRRPADSVVAPANGGRQGTSASEEGEIPNSAAGTSRQTRTSHPLPPPPPPPPPSGPAPLPPRPPPPPAAEPPSGGESQEEEAKPTMAELSQTFMDVEKSMIALENHHAESVARATAPRSGPGLSSDDENDLDLVDGEKLAYEVTEQIDIKATEQARERRNKQIIAESEAWVHANPDDRAAIEEWEKDRKPGIRAEIKSAQDSDAAANTALVQALKTLADQGPTLRAIAVGDKAVLAVFGAMQEEYRAGFRRSMSEVNALKEQVKQANAAAAQATAAAEAACAELARYRDASKTTTNGPVGQGANRNVEGCAGGAEPISQPVLALDPDAGLGTPPATPAPEVSAVIPANTESGDVSSHSRNVDADADAETGRGSGRNQLRMLRRRIDKIEEKVDNVWEAMEAKHMEMEDSVGCNILTTMREEMDARQKLVRKRPRIAAPGGGTTTGSAVRDGESGATATATARSSAPPAGSPLATMASTTPRQRAQTTGVDLQTSTTQAGGSGGDATASTRSGTVPTGGDVVMRSSSPPPDTTIALPKASTSTSTTPAPALPASNASPSASATHNDLEVRIALVKQNIEAHFSDTLPQWKGEVLKLANHQAKEEVNTLDARVKLAFDHVQAQLEELRKVPVERLESRAIDFISQEIEKIDNGWRGAAETAQSEQKILFDRGEALAKDLETTNDAVKAIAAVVLTKDEIRQNPYMKGPLNAGLATQLIPAVRTTALGITSTSTGITGANAANANASPNANLNANANVGPAPQQQPVFTSAPPRPLSAGAASVSPSMSSMHERSPHQQPQQQQQQPHAQRQQVQQQPPQYQQVQRQQHPGNAQAAPSRGFGSGTPTSFPPLHGSNANANPQTSRLTASSSTTTDPATLQAVHNLERHLQGLFNGLKDRMTASNNLKTTEEVYADVCGFMQLLEKYNHIDTQAMRSLRVSSKAVAEAYRKHRDEARILVAQQTHQRIPQQPQQQHHPQQQQQHAPQHAGNASPLQQLNTQHQQQQAQAHSSPSVLQQQLWQANNGTNSGGQRSPAGPIGNSNSVSTAGGGLASPSALGHLDAQQMHAIQQQLQQQLLQQQQRQAQQPVQQPQPQPQGQTMQPQLSNGAVSPQQPSQPSQPQLQAQSQVQTPALQSMLPAQFDHAIQSTAMVGASRTSRSASGSDHSGPSPSTIAVPAAAANTTDANNTAGEGRSPSSSSSVEEGQLPASTQDDAQPQGVINDKDVVVVEDDDEDDVSTPPPASAKSNDSATVAGNTTREANPSNSKSATPAAGQNGDGQETTATAIRRSASAEEAERALQS